MEEETKAIAALPDDALAGVLVVLPLRSLGVAQCVCKAWRDIIDDRALLLQHLHLLPRSVRGVFINYTGHYRPHLFSRPCSSSSTFPRIDGLLSFMIDDNEDEWWLVIDHCNGLLICHLDSGVYVCNPATQRWTLLPACATPSSSGPYYEGPYLAFDPAMSPHYEVFRIPSVPDDHQSMDQCWPPTPWTITVFSSRTGEWEDRSFVRQGEAAGTVRDMLQLDPYKSVSRKRYAAYCRGALYVHCQGSFVTRFSMSNDMYQVIRTPSATVKYNRHLGRSKNGVFFGAGSKDKLWMWILNESGEHMEWSLKYECELTPRAYPRNLLAHNIWEVVEAENYDVSAANGEAIGIETAQNKESFEWNSDDDDTTVQTVDKVYFAPSFDEILGFHPYKEVVFLALDFFGVMAYHLNSSKIQFLGYAHPDCYPRMHTNGIDESFVYTPGLIGELAEDGTGLRSSVTSADDDS